MQAAHISSDILQFRMDVKLAIRKGRKGRFTKEGRNAAVKHLICI